MSQREQPWSKPFGEPPPEKIETSSELVNLLKLKEYRNDGVPFELLVRLGIPQPSAAVIELRRRGYEIEEIGIGGGRRIKLIHGPGVGAKRRKRSQLSLLDHGKAA